MTIPSLIFNSYQPPPQALYADLPATLQTFTADMHSLCSGGLVDTKYIADYHTREKASFLEYIFRKRLRSGCVDKAKGRRRVRVTFVGIDGARLPLDTYVNGTVSRQVLGDFYW